jgi:hypothetical protein
MRPKKRSFTSEKSPDPHRHRRPPVKPPRVGHPVHVALSEEWSAGPAPLVCHPERSECYAKRSTHAVEGSLLRLSCGYSLWEFSRGCSASIVLCLALNIRSSASEGEIKTRKTKAAAACTRETRTLARHRMPYPWQFHETCPERSRRVGLPRTLPCMFIGHR